MDIGIKGYITETPPMGGEIKKSAEDFFVEEIIELELREEGNFAVVRVEKKNWETLKFVRALAKMLGISQKRISFAGTKDKRALTVQFFTINGIKREDLEKVNIKDSKIEFVGYSRRELRLGDLLGNFFRVRVVGAKNGEIFERTKEQLEEKGIPNFFRGTEIRYPRHNARSWKAYIAEKLLRGILDLCCKAFGS